MTFLTAIVSILAVGVVFATADVLIAVVMILTGIPVYLVLAALKKYTPATAKCDSKSLITPM